MLYTCARVSAALKLEVHDYYHNGARLAHEAHSRKKHTSAASIDAVQLRYALQSTPYAPDIGLAFNALAPPTERLAAGYVPVANKIYLIPAS